MVSVVVASVFARRNMAIEPYVRRRWPHMLISWTRLARGRFHDPMVGRDLLIGAIGGLFARLVWLAGPRVAHAEAFAPQALTSTGYSSPFALLWTIGNYSFYSVLYTLGWLVLLLSFRLVLHRPVLAAVALWLAVVPVNLYGVNVGIELLMSASTSAVLVVILYRYGALALGSGLFFMFVTTTVYSASDVRSLLPLLTLIALVLYAFHASLAGKPAFGALGIDEEGVMP